MLDPERPIPPRSSPNYHYLLDRAAEIHFRCELSNDPARLSGMIEATRPLPTVAERQKAFRQALDARLEAHRAERRALRTMRQANAYLKGADAALEQRRQQVKRLRDLFDATWTQRTIPQRYEALRAARQSHRG
jgi:hypothetical protein